MGKIFRMSNGDGIPAMILKLKLVRILRKWRLRWVILTRMGRIVSFYNVVNLLAFIVVLIFVLKAQI